MSAAVRQRTRIARVRRLQHGVAATSAVAAAGQLKNLELSRERLARMRGELGAAEGATSGAWLSAAGELAMRLDAARLGLTPSIDAARAAAAAREQARLRARREQESAERLEQAAVSAAAEGAERRMNRSVRRRGVAAKDEVTP